MSDAIFMLIYGFVAKRQRIKELFLKKDRYHSEIDGVFS